jgi:hypothetical protein
MTTPTPSKNTAAFFAQAALAFALALTGMIVGELYLPASGWTRAFLALGTVFLVTSSFTLAKCVRDAQENVSVISRLDQARLERLLAEFDPYQVPHLVKAAQREQNGAAQGPPAPPFPDQAPYPDPLAL